ncbi:MAG: hypothetical protein ACLF0P_06730 [Thermoanaerobaculia bacterium]
MRNPFSRRPAAPRRPHASASPAAPPGVLALVVVLLAPALASPARADVEVNLHLPQRAKIDLRGKESVTVAPFLAIAREGETTGPERDVDVEGEFSRYLEKILRRETNLHVVESGPLAFPTYDLEELLEDREFWQDVGERTQADLIVSGSLDFDIQDRTGYRTEEFVSPLDGRTYHRQVLVEQTGFEYDVLMVVVDGVTGRVLHRDNFKDFRSFPSGDVDPVAGMFENLYSLEDRILNVFSQQEVETTRVLFTGGY